MLLDADHRLCSIDEATSSEVVANLLDGIELTLGNLAYLVPSISNNCLTNTLTDQVGEERVNVTMRAGG